MLKIAITVENGRSAPLERGGEVGDVLTSLGILLSRLHDDEVLVQPLGFWTPTGRATVAATMEPTTVETRRDRLARRLIWTFLPGATGQGSIHVRLDVMMPGRGFMTDQEFHLRSELTSERFWVSVRAIQDRILDRAEALADSLS